MVASHTRGLGLRLQDCSGAHILALSGTPAELSISRFSILPETMEPGAVPGILPLHPHHLYLERGTRARRPHSRALVSCKQPWPCLPGPGGAGYGGRACDRASYQLNPNRPVTVQLEGPLFLASGDGSKARADFSQA